jgi:hypothetical protein
MNRLSKAQGVSDRVNINFRKTGIAALSAAVIVPFAVFGGTSFAQGSPSAAQYQYNHKVLVCHHGHTISIDHHAVPAHLRIHDSLGPCPAKTSPTQSTTTTKHKHHGGKGHSKSNTQTQTQTQTTTTQTHGNSGNHGNGNGNNGQGNGHGSGKH